MGKISYIILGIILSLVIIGGISYFKITKSPTVTAFLNIEIGEVKVNNGNGWTIAVDEMKLSLKDKIKTLGDGYASVVLFESAIISLEPNTEVLISDLSNKFIKIKQNSGSTWNKFTGLAGLEGLSVETPTTVATVRGTSFGVSMDSVMVGEGKVEVEAYGEKMIVNAEEKVDIMSLPMVAEMSADGIPAKARPRMIKTSMTSEDKIIVANKMTRSVDNMKRVREMEVEKHKFIAKQLQKKYGVNDVEINEYLERADKGEFDLEEVERKSPIRIESVTKIRKITEEIVEENRAIEKISQEAR